MMQTILISNTEAPNTYTPNSFLILLRGSNYPATVSNFGEEQDTSPDRPILTQNTRFRRAKRRDIRK